MFTSSFVLLLCSLQLVASTPCPPPSSSGGLSGPPGYPDTTVTVTVPGLPTGPSHTGGSYSGHPTVTVTVPTTGGSSGGHTGGHTVTVTVPATSTGHGHPTGTGPATTTHSDTGGAHPTAPSTDGGNSGGQCNTGSLQCCNSLQNANSSQVANLLGPLAVLLGPLTGQAGVSCTPITVIGVAGGSNCASQPVCCQDNSFGGAVSLGCTPVNIGL